MYKCAIIGCGKIAGGYDLNVPDRWSFTHAGAYHLCTETELVAAADTNAEALKNFGKQWRIQKLYKDYKEMLDAESIDILSLCLPTEKHFEAFKLACEKDIPAIFCEKPMSYVLEEAQEMARMSEGRIVTVNHFRRWIPAIAKIRNEIAEGVYGKMITITARYTKGIMVNGSHLIDLLMWFWGDSAKIDGLRVKNPDAVDPGIDFIMTFENGATAYFINIPDVNYVFIDVDILTEKGRIVIGQRGQNLTRYQVMLDPYFRSFHILRQINEVETDWYNCSTRAVQEIAACLKNGGSTSCTPNGGVRVMEICHQLLEVSRAKAITE